MYYTTQEMPMDIQRGIMLLLGVCRSTLALQICLRHDGLLAWLYT